MNQITFRRHNATLCRLGSVCSREAHLYFSVSHSKALLEEWFGFVDHCCEGYCLLNKFDVQFLEKEKRGKNS